MMSSNASSHAREKKVKFKTATSAEKAIEIIEADRPHLLLIDLQTPGLNVEAFGTEIKGLADAVCPLTIAYAQHVHVELLEQAKTAGFDQVMTRGQVNSRIANIIAAA
ncbi:MAG: hypothetical protein P8J27_16830 [Mariniblastus sp.]|nr:hypothetical protein [Mariniblastus sp.]